MARQERFNERLEQKIVAFEEQSQNELEKKASRRLPKALTEQCLPQIWKMADVTPLPKTKPVKELKKDLRPISLTACLSKVAEECVVVDYVKPAALRVLDPNQYGAVPNSSTTQALIHMVHHWSKETDGNGATANVREVYQSLVGRDDGREIQWDFSKSFNGPENKVVNQQILAGVQSTDHEMPVVTIKAAMRVHFRTKRRQEVNKSRNAAQDVLKQQRARSRLNTKKNQRVKALNLSTSLAAEDKDQYMKFMTIDYMSSEHSMSESEEGESNSEHGYESSDSERPKKKVFCVSSLQWWSPALTLVMHSLDRKSTRRRSAKGVNMLVEGHRTGIISSRLAPDDADPFALA